VSLSAGSALAALALHRRLLTSRACGAAHVTRLRRGSHHAPAALPGKGAM